MLLARFRIVGHSMEPFLKENENVLVSSLPFLFSEPQAGDVVVFERLKKVYVKRIKNKIDNNYFLIGDNKNDSEDSRKFGLIPKKDIKGKVIIKL